MCALRAESNRRDSVEEADRPRPVCSSMSRFRKSTLACAALGVFVTCVGNALLIQGPGPRGDSVT